MNVLITGGAGFIGSHLATRLLDRDFRVSVVDNLDHYYSPYIKKANISSLKSYKRFSFFKADICDEKKIARIFSKTKPDWVCHFAAKVGVRPSILYPHDYISINTEGTQRMLNLSTAHKVKHFLFASSSSVYGDSHHMRLKEEDICMPVSPYGVSKLAAEHLIRVHHTLHGLHSTILRFFTVYGPGGRPDMAPYLFVDHIARGKPIDRFGKGDSKRDYTFVDDIVDGILAAMQKDFPLMTFNLGSGHPISLNAFISLIETQLGKKATIRTLPRQAGDMVFTHADITKAKKYLGYHPQTSTEAGLRKFIQWYLLNKK